MDAIESDDEVFYSGLSGNETDDSSFIDESENSDSALDEDDVGLGNEIEFGELSYQFEPLVPMENDDDVQIEDIDVENEVVAHERLDNTDWCTCGECQTMPTLIESQCCREIPSVDAKIIQGSCITQPDEFNRVCIDRLMLQLAYQAHYDPWGRGRELEEPPEGYIYKAYRYQAYYRFVQWIFGPMGQYNLHSIPSCVVSLIRSQYPSDEYCGFRRAF